VTTSPTNSGRAREDPRMGEGSPTLADAIEMISLNVMVKEASKHIGILDGWMRTW
jgi:hypothetical protein